MRDCGKTVDKKVGLGLATSQEDSYNRVSIHPQLKHFFSTTIKYLTTVSYDLHPLIHRPYNYYLLSK